MIAHQTTVRIFKGIKAWKRCRENEDRLTLVPCNGVRNRPVVFILYLSG